MTKLPFDYQGNQVPYGTGQPMGAYSSWPMLAITHHVIVLVAAGNTRYTNYMILGDDLVIGDDEVALRYQAIMTTLGVDINEQKSHVSEDTYEFAKRWIHKGTEITGAPMRALLEVESNISAAIGFLESLRRFWGSPYLESRAVIAGLVQATTSSKRLQHLITTRLYEALLIPNNQDSADVRDEKARMCFQVLAKAYLGCTVSMERIWLVMNQIIPTIKLESAEKAIVATVKGINAYAEKLSSAATGRATAIAPELLLIHPVIKSASLYVRDLNLEVGRMNDLWTSAREEEILTSPPLIGFNPLVLVREPRSRVLHGESLRISKKFKETIKKYTHERQVALSDER